MAKILWIIVLSVIFFSSLINCQLGILHISNGVSSKEYCLVYNSTWSPLPETLESASQSPLMNMISTLLCDALVSPEPTRDKALVVRRGFCPFSQKGQIAQDLGASALLIASTDTLIPPSAIERSAYEKIRIPVALMRYRDMLDAQRVFGTQMQAKLYAPQPSPFDSSILLLLIATVTVVLGGYWSGECERELLSIRASGRGRGENKEDDIRLCLDSPLTVTIFVAVMCCTLVLTYFFYNVLVYLYIAIFCVGSAHALYCCMDAVMDKIGCGSMRFSKRNCTFSVPSLILAAACISTAVVWAVYRNEEQWIWVLQDFLAIAFCLYFMKTFSLPSFKICVILLGLLLVYDVFFVFITPYFTENGLSIMAQIASGPGASLKRRDDDMVWVPAEPQAVQAPSEKLPLLMLVPRFPARAQNLCGLTQFSMLGYGDILVPGLLVAYCSRFDVWINNSRKIYFVSCCIAYVLGMVVTFAAMQLTGMGQPALLYLVPFTLMASALVAWHRGEMKQFWAGAVYEGRIDQTSIL